MITATLVTGAERYKQKCLPVGVAINTWDTPITEYRPALRRKDIPTHAMTQRDLEDIETSQSQNDPVIHTRSLEESHPQAQEV